MKPYPEMTEAEMYETLRQAAALRKRLIYHSFDSRHSFAGFPDVVIANPPFVHFCELKTKRGTPSPAQEAWLNAFHGCDAVTAGVYRPDDLDALLELLA